MTSDKKSPVSSAVTVHSRQADGSLSAPIGRPEVVAPDTVVVRGGGNLRLPLVVVAGPGRQVDVVAIHLPESPKESESMVALEVAKPLLVASAPGLAKSDGAVIQARSPWCIFFPNLPMCRDSR